MDIKQLFFDYWKKGLIFISICIVITSSFLFRSPKVNKLETLQRNMITLTIEGDVNQAGTYQVPSDLSIDEVLNQFAKGLKTVDKPQGDISITNPDKKPFKPIPINTATVSELQNIPGVGALKAQKIIDYRTLHGPFKNQNDLMEVSGFGKVTVEKMLPYIDFTHV